MRLHFFQCEVDGDNEQAQYGVGETDKDRPRPGKAASARRNSAPENSSTTLRFNPIVV
jgi:hypothetical protein